MFDVLSNKATVVFPLSTENCVASCFEIVHVCVIVGIAYLRPSTSVVIPIVCFVVSGDWFLRVAKGTVAISNN